jgi:hypothetical protein
MPAPDTSAAAAAVQEELYKQATPLRRFTMALELSDLTHQFAIAGVRLRHPGYSVAEAKRALAEQLYGSEELEHK